MEYKITVERIEELREGENYRETIKIYEQKFKIRYELDRGEEEMLTKVIDAINK